MTIYKVKRFSFNSKILYLHGKDEEIDYPGGGIIYKTLSDYFDIDFIPYSSDPKIGYSELKSLNLSKYNLIFGFSLGGVMASALNKLPMILMCPGYGISKMWNEYKKVDTDSQKVNPDLVKSVIVCESDKYSEFYFSGIESRKLDDKVVWMPGKHVPEKSDIIKYLVPEVRKVLKNL